MEPIFVYSLALLFYATLKTAEDHRLVFYLEQLRSKSFAELISPSTFQHNGSRFDGIRAGATTNVLLR